MSEEGGWGRRTDAEGNVIEGMPGKDKVEVESRYWVWMAIICFGFPLWATVLAVRSTTPQIFLYGLFATILLTQLPAAIGALIGYHVEAKRLKKNESHWVPDRWAYTIGHFLFSPYMTAPIYLYYRWRNTKLSL